MSVESSNQDATAVKNYIEQELLNGRRVKLDDNTDLIEQGIIDSLSLLRLVTFLEENCQVQVLDEEIVPDNFRTLTAIRMFVSKRKAVGNPQGS